MAAQSKQSRGGDIAGVGTERNCLDHVGGRAYASSHHKGNIVSYSLVAQPLVNGGKGKLNGNSHVVAYSRGSRSRASAEAVDCDDVGAAAGDTRGNGGNVVHRRNLDDYGLFIFGGLFQRENKLTEVLNGINVVVRGGGNGVGALGDHAGFGNVAHDFC